jgi:hypothetical protein
VAPRRGREPDIARRPRDALVTAYLDAVQRRDTAGLVRLASPEVDPSDDIAALLEMSGGMELEDVSVSYLDEFGGQFLVATVSGTVVGDGSAVQLKIGISRVGDRHDLAAGSAVPPGGEADPASPR